MAYYNKALLLFAVLVTIACGEKNQEQEEDKIVVSDNISKSSSPALDSDSDISNKSENGIVEVSISASDQMQFNKEEIKVKAGSIVKLTLKHTGEMDKKVMGHNFVLLKQGVDISSFGQKAMQAEDNDYIPEDGEQVIAHTEILGGGESTTIEFQAPEAGTYDFICSFPGHYAIMKGKFIVE
ncbi:azurin [Autumnicola psychrophila]|uniref:Azurin n=1 Tax=Autumnicola psychrophila TaxID=3075592 RepID=A0ABU3DMP9_9FLAO|nr:azurin [Zunongwangia sp. F225]MDT0684976.1 azurin [Zunongwangia sp. F225]